jgi:hypothetical protein
MTKSRKEHKNKQIRIEGAKAKKKNVPYGTSIAIDGIETPIKPQQEDKQVVSRKPGD